MSTRVGTLQAPRAGGSILAAFLALFVMLTIAVVAVSIDQGQQVETTFGRSVDTGSTHKSLISPQGGPRKGKADAAKRAAFTTTIGAWLVRLIGGGVASRTRY